MTSLPSYPAFVAKAALPGVLLVWVGVLGAITSGFVTAEVRGPTAVGAGVGTVFGVVGIAIVAYAARLQFAPEQGQKARLTIQAAGFGNLVLKMLGVGGVMLTGFLLDVKFPVMVALGVAFAAAAVCIQIIGSLVVARILGTVTRGQARAPGS